MNPNRTMRTVSVHTQALTSRCIRKICQRGAVDVRLVLWRWLRAGQAWKEVIELIGGTLTTAACPDTLCAEDKPPFAQMTISRFMPFSKCKPLSSAGIWLTHA